MNKRQLVLFIIIGILGLALLANTTWMYEQMQISGKKLNVEKLLTQSVVYFMLFFLFGILIEWKQALKILSGRIYLNIPLFIISITLLVLSLIPPYQWLMWYGLGSFKIPFGILNKVMQSSGCHIALSILSGILLIRSLAKGSRGTGNHIKATD